MIKPTIGRVVLVNRGGLQRQWLPAQICYIHSDTYINVGGFDSQGIPFQEASLELRQDDVAQDAVHISESELGGRFACWMPYQRQANLREQERAAQVPAQR